MAIVNRTCTKCHQQKDISQFGKSRSLKGGITYWCLDCWREYHAEYRQANRERIRQRNRQYAVKYYKVRRARLQAAREKAAMEQKNRS